MPTPCYLVVETDRQALSLRRFGFGSSATSQGDHECPAREPWSKGGGKPGCNASTETLEIVPFFMYPEGHDLAGCHMRPAEVDHDDPRWPTHCDSCGEPFTHGELWQENGDVIMRVTAIVPGAAVNVGDEFEFKKMPPGAIWEALWAREWAKGFDGRAYMCRLPDMHDWQIDSEANNCTRKGDRTHRCWIREGEAPFLNISKNGPTCSAGAGSIQSPNYHGFLQHGVLT